MVWAISVRSCSNFGPLMLAERSAMIRKRRPVASTPMNLALPGVPAPEPVGSRNSPVFGSSAVMPSRREEGAGEVVAALRSPYAGRAGDRQPGERLGDRHRGSANRRADRGRSGPRPRSGFRPRRPSRRDRRGSDPDLDGRWSRGHGRGPVRAAGRDVHRRGPRHPGEDRGQAHRQQDGRRPLDRAARPDPHSGSPGRWRFGAAVRAGAAGFGEADREAAGAARDTAAARAARARDTVVAKPRKTSTRGSPSRPPPVRAAGDMPEQPAYIGSGRRHRRRRGGNGRPDGCRHRRCRYSRRRLRR